MESLRVMGQQASARLAISCAAPRKQESRGVHFADHQAVLKNALFGTARLWKITRLTRSLFGVP